MLLPQDFESVTTQFENLAKVQEAVADGLTISTTAASELAKMYPEILTNAEYAGNGQIQLNEEVVKSILAGNESMEMVDWISSMDSSYS